MGLLQVEAERGAGGSVLIMVHSFYRAAVHRLDSLRAIGLGTAKWVLTKLQEYDGR